LVEDNDRGARGPRFTLTQIDSIQDPFAEAHSPIDGSSVAGYVALAVTGYPRSLADQEIPVQSKMMTIADIFDALSAQVLPYKPAVPWEHALDILHDEARLGLIDSALLALSRAAEIFRMAGDEKANRD
jgi:HD domain-containing protein